MSKREALTRYTLIVKKLRKNPSTLEEIKDYLDRESDLQKDNFRASTRTIHRDIRDIMDLYNIEVLSNHRGKKYYINLDEQPEINERMLETFDTFHALNISERLSDYVIFEKRHPKGTENMFAAL